MSIFPFDFEQGQVKLPDEGGPAGKNEKGVPQPVVKEDLCRGCGACYSKCPAIREGKAIVISGVERQKQLPDEETEIPARAPASDEAATRS